MADINWEKYREVLLWEEDVLEDREQNLRMAGDYELAESYHRRLQEVKSRLQEIPDA